MIIYLLERIRKFFKSVGKKEEKINDLIIKLNFKKIFKELDLDKEDYNPNYQVKGTIKIAAVIAFFFDEKKLSTLSNVCENLNDISNQNEIYIITNSISSTQEEQLKKYLKNNAQVIIIHEILHNRLLPWYHLNLMKKLYHRKEITHFIYLEDDILLTKSNFHYWLNSRNILKKFNLIPGFVRTETDNNNKNLYAIDFVKKNKLQSLPKIKVSKNYYFVNHKFPYQGMYLYDRELMGEHINGPSSNPDCGHGAFDVNLIDSRMVNLDLMAKANIGLTYINVPNGFFNRMVTLYNNEKKEIDTNCQIKHLSNKYVNLKSWFGNIKVKDAIE